MEYSPKSTYSSNYWKLNKSILHENNFKVNFDSILTDILKKKDYFDSITKWFDACFKPLVRKFLIDFSKERQKCRKDTTMFYSVSLQEASQAKDWESIAFTKNKLSQMHQEDSIGLIVRSRFQESAEKERASLFHLNREVKKGKLSRIDKLAKEEIVITNGLKQTKRIILNDKAKIEKEAVNYFSSLFQGYHTTNGNIGPKPFRPNYTDAEYFLKGVGRLPDIVGEALTNELTLEEVN